jgi:hypothetical protein
VKERIGKRHIEGHKAFRRIGKLKNRDHYDDNVDDRWLIQPEVDSIQRTDKVPFVFMRSIRGSEGWKEERKEVSQFEPRCFLGLWKHGSTNEWDWIKKEKMRQQNCEYFEIPYIQMP